MNQEIHAAPLALVGIGCALPGIDRIDLSNGAAWSALFDAPPPMPWSDAAAPIRGRQIDDAAFDFKKFAIPPLFRLAVSRETRLALQAASAAMQHLTLSDALRDRCDQFCATHLGSDAAYRNATKIGALRRLAERLDAQGLSPAAVMRRIDDYKQPLAQAFGSSSHDRVGEMASSIPARIAHFARTRGKCQTLDGADLGGLRLLQLAQDCFRHADSRMAVLTAVQCFHHQPQADMLLAQGVSSSACWLEGAISLVVCPLNVAQEQGWPAIAQLSTLIAERQDAAPSAGYFAGANQVFCHLLDMLLQRQQTCVGHSFTGYRWRIDAASPPSLKPTASPRISIIDYQPITAQGLDKARFWQALRNGEDALRDHSPEQLPPGAFVRPTPQKLSAYTAHAMCFPTHDPVRLELTRPMMPAKKQRLDVTQLHALNGCAAWPDSLRRFERIAIIVASNLSLSADRQQAMSALWPALPSADVPLSPPPQPAINRWSWHGACGLGTAQLLAQQLGVEADCYAVEAACASSLAALHNAVRALQAGRYDAVLVGGIETATLERDMVLCSAQMMLSASRMRPFARQADGFTPGDGGGFFILTGQATSRAIATIEAISGSCDSYSMTAPDPEGQALAIEKTQSLSAVEARQIQYLEAHGTGTELGDRAEVASLHQGYHRAARAPLYIGSVKYNFGHCFAGAGALSLCKVLSAFEHGQIPPTPVATLNAELPLAAIPAEIPQIALDWPQGEDGRRAAINGFGTGGINYHLLIHQPI
ncbi:polyketide synthase [Serratia marcescens]|uniref:beta-ketoacyl [acyl carrier protein] synthase domain-containing protein n=1 Tax=Serratia marcescens TaxID=615 RepID=UPI000E58A2ED|nr:polyketide synthase [Serratia marcescens]AXX21428.1 3-ketoacyl-ACP synthase [Serratia marcescens]